jgi:fluoroacetyl-CoA thioesterase
MEAQRTDDAPDTPVRGAPTGDVHADPAVGLTATVSTTVTEADTAIALGSGDVPVLGTPRLLALAEAATVAALAPHFAAESAGSGGPPRRTSVGTRVELDHRAATPLGRHVTVTARLASVTGRRLTFDIVAHEGPDRIAEGRVERIVVDRDRFTAKAGVPR